MEKKCTKCKEIKQLTEFNKNKTKKDGYNNICRICSNLKSKEYYENNKEYHQKVIRERSKRIINENQQKYYNLLTKTPCIDCGETNPIVLEYDHKDGVDKIGGVGKLVRGGYSWDTILNEIEKCEVRCANCHRIRTSIQQNWYNNIIT